MSSSPIAVLLPHVPVTVIHPAATSGSELVAVGVHEQPGLLAALAVMPDPRDPRGVRYPLASMLAVAVCAVLAGAVTFAAIADWVRDLDYPAWSLLGFTGRIPAASTVWRLLVRVDAEILTMILAGWLRARDTATSTAVSKVPPAVTDRRWRRVIAVEGKVLRGSRRPDGTQVHLLSAYDTATGIAWAQVQIAAKSNEIPAFAPLLDRVARVLGGLTGVVIVADALHAQTSHAYEVATRGAYLMVTVKANRPTLHAQLKALPWAEVPVGDQRRDKGHGRKETRTVKALTDLTPGGLCFPYAEQAVRITRTRTVNGKTSRETAYPVISLPAEQAQPDQLQDWARLEWHIENRLHRIRDVTLREDAHRASTGNGPAVLRTPPSASTAVTAKPTSPEPPDGPTADPPTSG